MSQSYDATLQGTIPSGEEHQKITSPSVDPHGGYYGEEVVHTNEAVPVTAPAPVVYTHDDQSSFTRTGAAGAGGPQYYGGAYGKEEGYGFTATSLTSAGKARSILLSILSLLFLLFLIVWGFILIVPTRQLITQWYVFQLDFTNVVFTQFFQTDDSAVSSLTLANSGLPDVIRFGLFGYCTGSFNNFDDFVSATCSKQNLWSLNLSEIVFNQIQTFGSTEARTLTSQYGIHLPSAVGNIDSWQPKGAAVCYIILLILSFFTFCSFVWIVVVQATKPRTFKNGVFNFKAPLISIITISAIAFILYVIGASAITNYASSKIVNGFKSEREFGITASRSVLFFLFSWIGFAVSLIVLVASALSLWLYLQY